MSSDDKIWTCYPRRWITDDINGEIVTVHRDSRDEHNEGYGFGWFMADDIEDRYGACLFETPYSDFTLPSAKLRVIADFIDSLDQVEAKVNAASLALGTYQGIGLPGKIPIIRGGYEDDVLGYAVDEVGGAYTFRARQP